MTLFVNFVALFSTLTNRRGLFVGENEQLALLFDWQLLLTGEPFNFFDDDVDEDASFCFLNSYLQEIKETDLPGELIFKY